MRIIWWLVAVVSGVLAFLSALGGLLSLLRPFPNPAATVSLLIGEILFVVAFVSLNRWAWRKYRTAQPELNVDNWKNESQ
jgi:hypothetical protein